MAESAASSGALSGSEHRMIVTTAQGRVAGHAVRAGRVRAFLGIPYAAPPVGALRWRAPQPPAPWSGVREAAGFGPDCPQAPNPLFRAPCQDEDCLYLNVWAPADVGAGGLPVMVWVHGGGFVGGSGSDARCDGSAFATAGVIVVSLNYRSGIFGFLAHPGLSAESASGTSGNYGLLDQIAALQWVRENIAAFGGSPQRVTIFGVSAGSASIALLLTAPMARGLFQQAALHSPGTCRPLASLADAEQAGRQLGDDVEALRRLPAGELRALTPRLVPAMRGLTTPRILRPIRDGWLLPRDELPAFDDGDFAAVPTLLGINEDEGSKLTASWTVDTVAAYCELVDRSFGAMAGEARRVYPAGADADVRRCVAEIFADTQFNYGTWKLADAMAARGQPTWCYVFRRRHASQLDGPHHGDEVAYVFDNLDLVNEIGGVGYDASDAEVAAAMHGAWRRFAECGDPNGGGLPHWPRFERTQAAHLEFGDRPVPGQRWRAAQIAFIDAFCHARP